MLEMKLKRFIVVHLKASFYVNDFEQNSITSGDADTATKAWADEMKQLSGNKKYYFILMRTL